MHVRGTHCGLVQHGKLLGKARIHRTVRINDDAMEALALGVALLMVMRRKMSLGKDKGEGGKRQSTSWKRRP